MASALQQSKDGRSDPAFPCLDLSLGGIYSQPKTPPSNSCDSFCSQQACNNIALFHNQAEEEEEEHALALLPSIHASHKASSTPSTTTTTATTTMLDVGSQAPSSSATPPRKSPHHFVNLRKQGTLFQGDQEYSLNRTEALAEEMKEQKKARRDNRGKNFNVPSSLCNSSATSDTIQDAKPHLYAAGSLLTGYEHPSSQSCRVMKPPDSDSIQILDSMRIHKGGHQRQSDMKKAMMPDAPAASGYPWDSAAHQSCQGTPSFASCSHSPGAVSCTSCASWGCAQADPSSPTQTASCPSSSLSLLPSSGSSSVLREAPIHQTSSNGYKTTVLETSANGLMYVLPISKRKPSDGEEESVNHMLPAKRKSSTTIGTEEGMLRSKRKPSIGDEEGKSSHSSSSELLENEIDNLEYEQSSMQKRVGEIKAPQSRCGSNSDMIGSVDPPPVMPSTSPMVYTHPFAVMPVQGPFPLPLQWGLSLPYAMHYPSFMSHQLPENTPLLWNPYVPASPANAMQSSVCNGAAPPYKESVPKNNEGTSVKEKSLACELTLGTPSLVQKANMPPLLSIAQGVPLSNTVQGSRPLEIAHAGIPGPVIDVCPSASRPLSSSLKEQCSSISHAQEVRLSAKVCASTFEPVNVVCASATSVGPLSSLMQKGNFSGMGGDSVLPRELSLQQQDDQLKASKSSAPQASCIKGHSKSSCVQNVDVVGLGGHVQSLRSMSPRRKPVKTVRFSTLIGKDFAKSNTNGDGTSTLLSESSGMCKSEMDDGLCVFEKRTVGREASCSLPHTSCADERTTRESSQDEKLPVGGEASCSLPHTSCADERTTQERSQDEGSENTGIASESSDQEVGAAFAVKGGKLEGKTAAELPWVSTTGVGPNGKTIHGVMYITKSKRACLICSCHGTHMSPSEFVQHSGSTDLRNPERSIVVGCFPFVNQVVPLPI